MDRHHLEDIHEGDRWDLDKYHLTREEIVEFAEKYDPQPFHLDEEAARQSIFGELIASGWQTACIYIRLLTEGFLEETSHLAGKRVTELQWTHPVYPDDVLTGTVKILDTWPSSSDSSRGYVEYRIAGTNQDGESILRMELVGIFGRRSADGEINSGRSR